MATKNKAARGAAPAAPFVDESLDWMPVTLVGEPGYGVEDLRSLPGRIDFCLSVLGERRQGFFDTGRGMQLLQYLRRSKREALLALKAIDAGRADAAARCAAVAVGMAWEATFVLALMPRLKRDRARQAGASKSKKPLLDGWIDDQLAKNPKAKSPDLWPVLPRKIKGDDLHYERFAKRVTQRRKLGRK